MDGKLGQKLKEIENDCEQAAREIYYAMTYMDRESPGRANLHAALRLLGIHSPEYVGLSKSIITKDNRNII